MGNSASTSRYLARRYAEIDLMPKIPCACGCGTMIPPINKKLKPATYAHNHHPKSGGWEPGHVPHNKGKPYLPGRLNRLGKKLSAEEIAQRTATRRAKNGGEYGTKRGWKHTPETIERNRQAQIKRDLKGPNNPFYGKSHTPEVRARLRPFLPGEDHLNWNGGAGTLPYGPEFTKRFKRLIRDRDHHTCQRCGKTRAQVGKTLEVHHMDHDKMNNDPTNLVASCHSCNVWSSYHRDEPFRQLA